MAQFAPVCPIDILNHLDQFNELGNYHLLLAHDVVKPENCDRFRKLFNPDNSRKNFSAGSYPGTIIMDNSVIELGNAVNPEMVANAAAVVRANVIVLPDVIKDSLSTVSAIYFGYTEWMSIMTKTLGREDWSFMVVPQGKTLEDYIICAEALANVPDDKNLNYIRWWGIGKNFTDVMGVGREMAVEILSSIRPDWNIHLLGFSEDIHKDVIACKHPLVSGIDSAVPLRCNFPISMTTKLGRRGNWWEEVRANTHQVENVKKVRSWFGNTPRFPGGFR